MEDTNPEDHITNQGPAIEEGTKPLEKPVPEQKSIEIPKTLPPVPEVPSPASKIQEPIQEKPAPQINPTPTAQTQAQTPPPKKDVPNLRTLKGDIASAVKHQSMSLAQMAIKEADRRRSRLVLKQKSSRAKNWFILLSIILILGAFGIIGYYYFFASKNTGPIDTTTGTSREAIIATEVSGEADITNLHPETVRDQLANYISEQPLRLGSIENIVVVKTVNTADGGQMKVLVPASEFIDDLGAFAPDRLLRFLDRNFLLGRYAYKETSGFLLLKTQSFQTSLAEMLSWEKTLGEDLYPVLTNEPLPDDIRTLSFTDKLIKNIDTRSLYNSDGNLIMLYSFLGSRDTIFIGTSQDTFEEVLARFQTPHQVVQ